MNSASSIDFAVWEDRTSRPVRILRTLWRFAARKPLGAAGLVVIVLLILTAIFADALERSDPNALDTGSLLQSPRSDAWFGTDHLGRDLYSRVVAGSRVAVAVGFVSVAIATIAGTAIGLTSGYYGGKIDLVIQRFVDAIIAFPALVLGLAVVTAIGPSVRNIIIAIAFVSTPGFSRVVRASVLGVKNNMYVEAAHSLGQTTPQILLRHILPNVMSPIIVVATGSVGAAILAESGLSFLGLGPPPPDATWGSMLAADARFHITTAWWLAVVPSVAISVTVLGCNLLGDALRDVLDPRLRGTR